MSIRFAFAACVSLCFCGFPPAVAAAQDAAAPIRVACVGDSITQGVHVGREDKYPSVLGRLLGARYQVRNFGFLCDFSFCGYRGGGAPIPDVPARVVVEPATGDATELIQAAIERVAAMPPDHEGFRGAVLLTQGRFHVSGQLRITTGGVVLRGSGDGENGTVLVAAGTGRRSLIEIGGWAGAREIEETRRAITDKRIPAGGSVITVADAAGLKVGDAVMIRRPSTRAWIHGLGMDRFRGWHAEDRLHWREGTRDLVWERRVADVTGNRVTLDAPLTSALQSGYGGAGLCRYIWPERVAHCGVENLRCVSEFAPDDPLDEEHSWVAVQVLAARDAWVRKVTALHFACSAVSLEPGSLNVTVSDCRSLAPVSELGGARRRSFYAGGQCGLFVRCFAEQGRHDFAAGLCAAGPNAFVDCTARGAHLDSGPIESWASGVLYDNVAIEGAGLFLGNRGDALQGMGWAAADCVLWNCTAATIHCDSPPTALNRATGCKGKRSGKGLFTSHGTRVEPNSLYRRQLTERLGAIAVQALESAPVLADHDRAARFALSPGPSKPAEAGGGIEIVNGWFVHDGKVVWGGRNGPDWYQGHMVPGMPRARGRNIARWSPCKTGRGLTEDLARMTDDLLAVRTPLFEHSYGLWYERRRVNHDTPRRSDAEVWPPFLEQPWARSGKGRAWDGLSRYDLTTFNPWYFGRLREFARLGEAKGVILYYNCYEQHNLLESPSHWVDSPWRPANCLQNTGLPDAIPVGRLFYDTTHPLRSDLQRRYLTKVLDELGLYSGVLFFPSKEYTGPLPWIRNWVDTIVHWEERNDRQVHIGLMCTKDVVDAILTDPVRGPAISVIDTRLWWYLEDGTLYAPRADRNMAPRQYEAEFIRARGGEGVLERSPATVYRTVREYRDRYPDKAVISHGGEAGAWPVFMAGGAMFTGRLKNAEHGVAGNPTAADLHLVEFIGTHLRDRLQRTMPADLAGNDPAHNWCLAEPGGMILAYASAGGPLTLDLSAVTQPVRARWFDPESGRLATIESGRADGAGKTTFPSPAGDRPWLLWLMPFGG